MTKTTKEIKADQRDYILKIYSYDSETGIVTRKLRRYFGREVYYPVNEISGTKSHGYICSNYSFEGKNYRIFNHRIAWIFMTHDPVPRGYDIDHINGQKDDNRWENLRLAKRGQNNMNSGNRLDNTSGHKGVHRVVNKNKYKPFVDHEWWARIKCGKTIHLGVFKTYEEAVKARKEAEVKYFGEFAKS